MILLKYKINENNIIKIQNIDIFKKIKKSIKSSHIIK